MSKEKIDLIYDTMTTYHTESRERMTRIETDLREHKEGVAQNRNRIQKLEEPGRALNRIKDWAKWIVIVALAAAVLKEYL